jgi:hypothetical protein
MQHDFKGPDWGLTWNTDKRHTTFCFITNVPLQDDSDTAKALFVNLSRDAGCHDHVTEMDLYDNFFLHSNRAHATQPLSRVDSHMMTHLLVSDSFLGQRS